MVGNSVGRGNSLEVFLTVRFGDEAERLNHLRTRLLS